MGILPIFPLSEDFITIYVSLPPPIPAMIASSKDSGLVLSSEPLVRVDSTRAKVGEVREEHSLKGDFNLLQQTDKNWAQSQHTKHTNAW